MPLYLKKELENRNTIAVWEITETVEELTSMVDLLEDDKQKLASFRLEARKKEWLAVRVLVKKLLGKSRRIFYKESGAPYFNDIDLHIGISHTNGFAGIAVAPMKTSLDMEKASPRIERVFQRFVNEDELSFIPSDDRINYYNLIWCAKETLFKLLDRHDVIFKKNFNVRPVRMKPKGTVTADVSFPDVNCEVIMGYEVMPEFTLTYYIKHTGDDIQ
jgi:4'-phosphopantetheinyl transferase EntD